MADEFKLEHFPQLSWDDAAPAAAPPIRGALERVLEKQDAVCLNDNERFALANCSGADLLALLVAADTLRRDLVGNIVTYVVNRNINFTNICFVGCKFCAFSRGPREADTYFHSLEDMARKAKEAWELGATSLSSPTTPSEEGPVPRFSTPSSPSRAGFLAAPEALPRGRAGHSLHIEVPVRVGLRGRNRAQARETKPRHQRERLRRPVLRDDGASARVR